MRPIRRGISPKATDYSDYRKAKPDLVKRLGEYCSFCERRVNTNLAVEHIQPKGVPAYAHLIGRWDNFLLACVNCNSTKNAKTIMLSQVLLPDRDNTFVAFTYLPNGALMASIQAKQAGLQIIADASLQLTGLDSTASNIQTANGKQVALDRVRQRKEVWLLAETAKSDLQNSAHSNTLRKWVVSTAVKSGFFSVWMTVFADDADMRLRLINAFPGTAASGCFDLSTGAAVSPAPNLDNLVYGGKL